jgi:hypothetical protein
MSLQKSVREANRTETINKSTQETKKPAAAITAAG